MRDVYAEVENDHTLLRESLSEKDKEKISGRDIYKFREDSKQVITAKTLEKSQFEYHFGEDDLSNYIDDMT